MTDNEIAKHFQSFCKELVAVDSYYMGYKPSWYQPHYGLCTNFKYYVQNWDLSTDRWLIRLFRHNNLNPDFPFNENWITYNREFNKFTNPDRLAFIRKYANEFPEIN